MLSRLSEIMRVFEYSQDNATQPGNSSSSHWSETKKSDEHAQTFQTKSFPGYPIYSFAQDPEAVYFRTGDKLYHIKNCFQCGKKLNLCSARKIESSFPPDVLISGSPFACHMLGVDFASVPTERYLWTREDPMKLSVISLDNLRETVGRCNVCSPFFNTSSCMVRNHDFENMDEMFSFVVEKKYLDSYPLMEDSGYMCKYLVKWRIVFLRERNNFFVFLRSPKVDVTNSFYFVKDKAMYLVQSCTPCRSGFTLCPDDSDDELSFIQYIIVDMHDLKQAGITRHKDVFRCSMYSIMDIPQRAAIFTPYHITPGGGEKCLGNTTCVSNERLPCGPFFWFFQRLQIETGCFHSCIRIER